ncbi:hypothetical protein [Photorhabdus viridis]|uniref:hypothetical protein n=1 Tax=Photorhabdus viridis TaxID=3163327 RepID=UPI003307144C
MSWPIPEIPELKPVAPLRYKIWFVILLLILVVGTFVYAFLKDTTDFVHAVLNRYERYCTAAYAWEAASAETHFQWQQ